MKRLVMAAVGLGLTLSLGCLKREVEVTLKLSNPSNKVVPFKLEYTLPDGTVQQFRTYTPKDYVITIKKDETLKGWVIKDTLDMLDVLHFQALLDGEEKLVNDITLGLIQKLEFQVIAD